MFVPKFTLRSADNSTQVFLLTAVQNHNFPQDPRETVVISSFRGKGAVVIDGGAKAFDGAIEFVLWDDVGGYDVIEGKIDALIAAVPIGSPLILRIEKTASTWYDYHVKRIVPFEFPGLDQDLRIYRQKVKATFLVNAW